MAAFTLKKAKLESQSRDFTAHKASSIYYLGFYRNFANLWSGMKTGTDSTSESTALAWQMEARSKTGLHALPLHALKPCHTATSLREQLHTSLQWHRGTSKILLTFSLQKSKYISIWKGTPLYTSNISGAKVFNSPKSLPFLSLFHSVLPSLPSWFSVPMEIGLPS